MLLKLLINNIKYQAVHQIHMGDSRNKNAE